MAEEYTNKEKREFLRYDYGKPIDYSTIESPRNQKFSAEHIQAMSKNLSTSGLLFITKVKKVPNISSLLVLDLDIRTAAICQEIETHALIIDNKLLARVVRIEDNEDGTCGVGVAFVTKADPLLKDLANIEDLIKTS